MKNNKLYAVQRDGCTFEILIFKGKQTAPVSDSVYFCIWKSFVNVEACVEFFDEFEDTKLHKTGVKKCIQYPRYNWQRNFQNLGPMFLIMSILNYE